MRKRTEVIIWSVMLIFMVGYGIALATLWSEYGELAVGNIVAADDFLVRDLSDTALGAGGTQKRYQFGSMTTDLSKVMPVVINTDANGMSQADMTTAGMYGTIFFATGSGTWLVPDALLGMNFCLYSTAASEIIINPDASDDITLNGVLLDNGDAVINSTAEAVGDFICFVAQSNTHWFSLGRQGTWTDGGTGGD